MKSTNGCEVLGEEAGMGPTRQHLSMLLSLAYIWEHHLR